MTEEDVVQPEELSRTAHNISLQVCTAFHKGHMQGMTGSSVHTRQPGSALPEANKHIDCINRGGNGLTRGSCTLCHSLEGLHRHWPSTLGYLTPLKWKHKLHCLSRRTHARDERKRFIEQFTQQRCHAINQDVLTRGSSSAEFIA